MAGRDAIFRARYFYLERAVRLTWRQGTLCRFGWISKSMKKVIVCFALFLFANTAWASPESYCGRNLPFGAPSVSNPTSEVCHEGYAAAVDDNALIPRWVAYRLTGEHSIGCNHRDDDFHAEEQLSGKPRQEPDDYKASGYDRGHQAPAQDFAWSSKEMSDSFSMANMAPQVSGLNRDGWEYLEETVRAWAFARGELIIYVGPVVAPNALVIGRDRISVPQAFWKVVIDPHQHKALAFLMPQANVPKGNLKHWQTTIADVERASGVSLRLPAWVEVNAMPSLWQSSIAGWRKEKQRECGVH